MLVQAKATHPDRFTDPDEKAAAHDEFTAVGAAFQVLSDRTFGRRLLFRSARSCPAPHTQRNCAVSSVKSCWLTFTFLSRSASLRSAYDASLSQSLTCYQSPQPSAFARPRAASHAHPTAPRAHLSSTLSHPPSGYGGYDRDQHWGSASFPQPRLAQGAPRFGPPSAAGFGVGGAHAQSGWQDPPREDPFDLFLSTMQSINQLTDGGLGRGGSYAGMGGSQRRGSGGAELGREPSRVGQQELPGLLSGMLGGQAMSLPEAHRGGGGGSSGGWSGPPTPGSGPGWETPPAGMGANPWGRTFAGNVSPGVGAGGRGGAGRTIKAKLNEGERQANGDYHVSLDARLSCAERS